MGSNDGKVKRISVGSCSRFSNVRNGALYVRSSFLRYGRTTTVNGAVISRPSCLICKNRRCTPA